jgi:phage tail-like protein
MAVLNAVGVRSDPVLNHNFVVSLIDSSSILGSLTMSAIFDAALGGFSECSGLEMSMQPEEYKQGGNNGYVHKFPARVTWSNITLKKGIGADTGLWDWHYGFVEGRGTRRDGVIALLTDLHMPNTIWCFRRGLPVKYTGPAMNATQNNVAIEALEIAHEGIYQIPVVSFGPAPGGAGAGFGA